MPGSIDEIEYVILPFIFILHLNGMTFNGNPPFALKIHIVQKLILLFAVSYGMGEFEKAVCQRTLSVVNMRNDAKIPDVLHNFFKPNCFKTTQKMI